MKVLATALAGMVASALLSSGVAMASGTASAPPPPPPAVDYSVLPASADVQSLNPDGKPHPVRARLLLDQQGVVAGSAARVGLHLKQAKGWHTYWKSPGEIGLPTEITWTTPEGVAVAPHAYPVPQRFDQEGIVSFGYDDQVLLISELAVGPDVAPGLHVLHAEASWLVCLTSCIPGKATLEIPFEVLPVGARPAKTGFTALFDHYAAQHPTDPLQVDGVGFDMSLSASAVRPNEPFKAAFLISPTGDEPLELDAKGAWPTFTPIVGFDWMVNELKVTRVERGVRVIIEGETFEPDPLPTDDRIGGLVQVKVGGEWVRTEVTMPLPWAAAGAAVVPSTSPLFALAPDGAPPADPPSGGGEPELRTGSVAEAGGLSGGLVLNLLLAFVGGLILNVMPCVLPVITLKLYGLVEQTDITAREQRSAGIMYTGGILASFWALAAVIIGLKLVAGVDVDWGFQFQYPPYVAALATIVFAFGLSLFGVFEIPALGVGAASEATSKEGAAGYFFTGVFATLLATPCSAPFLGTAIAFAFAAPPLVLFAIFSFVGLGLAAPFLLVALVPAAYRLLPRPGAWMEAFKQLLGFTLIATTVWLVDVLIAQVGGDRAVMFMVFLMFVALGAWVYGRWGGLGASGRQQLLAGGVGIGIAVGAGVLFLDLEVAAAETCDDGTVQTDLSFHESIPWQAFSEERVAALAGSPVFIDFTADWCLTCKVNENAILETRPVRDAMAEHGVVPLKADWTRRDPVITEWLRRFDRAGVPMYLVLPAEVGAEAVVLPEVITPGLVIDALAAAG